MSEHTLNADVPAHLFHKLFGNGEAQSGPPEFPCCGGIGLRKRLEQQHLGLWCNANPRVGHGKFNRGAIGRLLAPGYMDHHLAPLRELERIASQIHHDLTDAAGVTPERRRHFRMEEVSQLNALALCRLGEEV